MNPTETSPDCISTDDLRSGRSRVHTASPLAVLGCECEFHREFRELRRLRQVAYAALSATSCFPDACEHGGPRCATHAAMDEIGQAFPGESRSDGTRNLNTWPRMVDGEDTWVATVNPCV